VDFLKLVHKREQKADNKIIFGLIGLLFLIALFFVLVNFLPKKEYRPLFSYLPADTNFYYHFTDKKVFYQDILEDFKIFDSSVATDKVKSLENLLGASFLNAREIVWFRTDQSDSDSYLIRFSHLQKKSLTQIQNDHSNMYFFQADNDILLVSYSLEVYNEFLSKEYKDEIATSRSQGSQGIDMYWQLGHLPEFLNDLIPYLFSIFESGDAYANFYRKEDNGLVINLYGTSPIPRDSSFFQYKSPLKPDFVLAFSKYTPQGIKNSLENDLIRLIFSSLPYYNLNSQSIEQAILSGGVIFQRDGAWLIATPLDSSAIILDLVDYYQVKEQKNTLSDGTLYIELLANDNPNKIEYSYKDKTYFQVSNVFVYQEAGINYLSSNEAFVWEIIELSQPLSNLWLNCQPEAGQVSDFIYLDTNKLDNDQIKEYLSNKGVNKLWALSYYTASHAGLQFCL